MVDFVGLSPRLPAPVTRLTRPHDLAAGEDPAERRSRAADGEIKWPAATWQKLGNIDAAVLANFLKNEYPQTIAVILSKIRADHAANVLRNLPNELSVEVVGRMLRPNSCRRKRSTTSRTRCAPNSSRRLHPDPPARPQ